MLEGIDCRAWIDLQALLRHLRTAQFFEQVLERDTILAGIDADLVGRDCCRPYGACDFPGHIIDDLFDQTVRAGAYVAHDPDACRRGSARELIESAQQSLT